MAPRKPLSEAEQAATDTARAERRARRGKRLRAIGNELQRLILLSLGIAVSALGFALFQVPNNLAAGGVSGIGIIVNYFTGFSPSLFYFIANIPLLVLGYWALGGWKFLYRTILAVVGFTLITEYAARVLPSTLEAWPITDNILLAAIYAGLVSGIGGGLIYLAGGTLGGTAIVGRIIQVRTGFPLSQIYLLVDGAIVLTAGFVFGWEIALYAFLTLLLGGMATDYVLEGPSRTRTATIITTRPQE
ncbi:MAG: YitT family protein, partial [Caldilineaceae bacterium]